MDRIDLNTPSVNAPTMPGVISTVRRVRNVTDQTLTYTVGTQAPAGTSSRCARATSGRARS
jgi:hypothetical protein